MSKQSPKPILHSVPVLSEDLSLDFRTPQPKDIVFLPLLQSRHETTRPTRQGPSR